VRSWIEHEFRPIPLAPKQKKPVHNDWPRLDFGADPARYFNADSNIGVVDGERIVDVDIDCAEPFASGPSSRRPPI
jgi:hypothetical protein